MWGLKRTLIPLPDNRNHTCRVPLSQAPSVLLKSILRPGRLLRHCLCQNKHHLAPRFWLICHHKSSPRYMLILLQDYPSPVPLRQWDQSIFLSIALWDRSPQLQLFVKINFEIVCSEWKETYLLNH